jgi:hypothetical protein
MPSARQCALCHDDADAEKTKKKKEDDAEETKKSRDEGKKLVIRKIEPVQPQKVAPPAPPSGSIRLGAFLRFANFAKLTEIAAEVAAGGQTPDVVVWAKSDSGFDHVRIAVVLPKEEAVQQGKRGAHLEIAEATGKFESLAQYIGKKILYDEVMGHKSQDPKRGGYDHERAVRTAALNDVLVEADEHLRAAEARRRAKFAGNKK